MEHNCTIIDNYSGAGILYIYVASCHGYHVAFGVLCKSELFRFHNSDIPSWAKPAN